MLRNSLRRWETELKLLVVAVLVISAFQAAVALDRLNEHHPLWDNMMGKLIPSRNKASCVDELIPLGLTVPPKHGKALSYPTSFSSKPGNNSGISTATSLEI